MVGDWGSHRKVLQVHGGWEEYRDREVWRSQIKCRIDNRIDPCRRRCYLDQDKVDENATMDKKWSIDKLDGSNWVTWKFQMRHLLLAKEL